MELKHIMKAVVAFLNVITLFSCGQNKTGKYRSVDRIPPNTNFPHVSTVTAGSSDMGLPDTEVPYSGSIRLSQLNLYEVILERDLAYLANSQLVITDEHRSLFDVKSSDSGQAIDWLEKRLAVIIGPHPVGMSYKWVYPEDEAYGIVDASENFSYPDNGTLAVNIGSAIYIATMKNITDRQVFPIISSDGEDFPILSPRKGAIQIAPSSFSKFGKLVGSDLSSSLNSVVRIATLFHEARHSDGNRESQTLGFSHIECPAGHDYAGKLACDNSGNGPYSIGLVMLKILRKSLKLDEKLSSEARPALDMIELDLKSRILDRGKWLDASGEAPLEFVDYSDFLKLQDN